MADNRHVLDTSALLTLMEDEPGAERVAAIVGEGSAILPFVVLIEAYYITYQERGRDEADRRYALMRQLPAQFEDTVDEPLLLTAGRLKAVHRLSLADAMIAALAQVRDAVLVHKDPEYGSVVHEVRQEALPYKGGAASGKA